MKLKWGSKKLTFVIIPENADRSVTQLRLTSTILYMVGASIAGLIILSIVMYGLQVRTDSVAKDLKTELSGKSQQFDQTLASKDETIQQLQNDVIHLSQQAKEVKQKMDEMKQLEADLRSMTGKSSGKTASATDGSEGTGVGGVMIPVNEEEIRGLSEVTSAQFTDLSKDMNELQQSMSTVIDEVEKRKRQLRMTPSIWPVDSRSITSPFGYRKDPLTLAPSFHSGVDIGEHENAPVRVTADGIVISTGYDNSRGNNILVDHSNGLQTLYMHLNQILVRKGDKLNKGDKIGLVGSTGRSTGFHLHYEMIKNGQIIDPSPYLK